MSETPVRRGWRGRRRLGIVTVVLTVGAALGALGGTSGAMAKSGVKEARWWPEVRKIESLVAKQRWKAVRNRAPELARQITRQSWYHPDLPQIFADLTFYEAVARANLEESRDAVWLWHAAQNIHPPMRDRELEGYGVASRLFRENPLRARGAVPYAFSNALSGPVRGDLEMPTLEEKQLPVVLRSIGANEPGTARPMRVELILDTEGRPHQPIVLLPVNPHPAVMYGVLRVVPARKLTPARLNGEARPMLFTLDVSFQILRGASPSQQPKKLTADG